jgi:threonyl-tRNA synthetase
LWQGPTIQVDFNMPQKFDVCYIGEDGEEHQTVMVHRTVLGSMERFMSCLLENYGGAFPSWLAPVQAVVLPIAERHADYAQQVCGCLKEDGLRAVINSSSETIGKRIREAQLAKVPYMLVIGDREMSEGTVAVRLRSGEQMPALPLDLLREKLLNNINKRDLDIAL